MAILESPEDLKNYCLRKLGSPVINIEIDDTQTYDRIEDAVNKFVLQHYSGAIEVYKVHVVTDAEVKKGYINPGKNMAAVLDVMDVNTGSSGSSLEAFERIDFLLAQTDIFANLAKTDMTGYYLAKSHLSLLNDMLTTTRVFQHNNIRGALYINEPLFSGMAVVLHGWESLDAEKDIFIYDDIWIKKYATQLIKQQWGSNVKKYTGVSLPGGLTMDGQTIYQEATDEIATLEEEFSLKYELPVDFFMGPSFI